MDRRRSQPDHPQSGRVVMARSDWHALLPDRCPAYLSWEQYERNVARLEANRYRATTLGAVRKGAALLAGLVVCGRCGTAWGCTTSTPMAIRTRSPTTVWREKQLRRTAVPACGRTLLRRLCHRPGAGRARASLPGAVVLGGRAVEQERGPVAQLWDQRRERAAYETDRAARQYQAVEPENRLVARTLERAWEEKLQAQQTLEEEYHRFLQQQPRVLTAEERDAIRQLAADIPALWNAPTTTNADRKEILRQVVERVEVEAQGKASRCGSGSPGREAARPRDAGAPHCSLHRPE